MRTDNKRMDAERMDAERTDAERSGTDAGRPVVVKVSGKVADEYDRVAADIAELVAHGHAIVVVHGGSAVIDRVGEAMGVPPRSVLSVSGIAGRFTGAEDIDPLLMACAGLMNKRLVLHLRRHGVTAFGLTGLDGGVLRGPRKDVLRVVEQGRAKVLRGNHSGFVDRVDAGLLAMLLQRGMVPVIAPVALGHDLSVINVDGDRAAAAVAVAMCARDLVMLSDIAGLTDRAGAVVHMGRADEIANRLMPLADGRMRIKLLAADEALQGGVARVVIASAAEPTPVRAALRGGGTQLTYGG